MITAIWMKMYGELLNIRSCSDIPDLMMYRRQLVELLEARVTVSQLNSYVDQLRRQLCG